MKFFIYIALISFVFTVNTYALDLIDDFNDGNTNGWTQLAGDFTVDGNGLLHQNTTLGFGASPAPILQLNGITPDSYVIQADIGIDNTSIGNNSVGFAARIQDVNNFLYFHFFPSFPGGAFRVERMLNGSSSTLLGNINVGFQPVHSTFYTFKLEVNGNNFTVSIKDGVGDSGFDFVQNFTNSTFSGGGVGLANFTGTAFYDNVKSDVLFNANTSVPEPSTWLLCIMASLGLFIRNKLR